MNARLAMVAGCALALAASNGPAFAVTTWSVTGVFPDQTTVTGTFDYDGALVSNISLQTFAGSGLSAATYTHADTTFFGGMQAPFLNAPAAQATTDTRLLSLILAENLPASAPPGKGIAGVLGGQSVEGFCDVDAGLCDAVDNQTRPFRALTGLTLVSQGPAVTAPIPVPATVSFLATGILALFGIGCLSRRQPIERTRSVCFQRSGRRGNAVRWTGAS